MKDKKLVSGNGYPNPQSQSKSTQSRLFNIYFFVYFLWLFWFCIINGFFCLVSEFQTHFLYLTFSNFVIYCILKCSVLSSRSYRNSQCPSKVFYLGERYSGTICLYLTPETNGILQTGNVVN